MSLQRAIDLLLSGDPRDRKELVRKVGRRATALARAPWLTLVLASKLVRKNPHIDIDRDVWQTVLLRCLGVHPSVHTTLWAQAENAKLRAQLRQHGGELMFPLPGGSELHLPPDANVREVAPNDLREILSESIYEQGEVTIRPGDVVLDCGANIGLFSLLALSRSGGEGHLVCVEPVPAVRAILEKNLRGAAPPSAWDVVDRPLFSDVRALRIVVSDVFTMHHLSSSRGPAAASETAIDVQTRTIDDLVEELRLPRVDFIKMDIEGAEMAALAGARATLARWKPRLAISAYHLYDDFFRIPDRIHEINPAYQLHVRRGVSPMCYGW